MDERKIRIFLGGYVNFLNAQNINCRALSEYLDQEKFDVWTILFWYQNASDFKKVPGVHYLRSCRPVRLLGWIPYFIGLLICDVAFLPKREYNGFCHFIARLSGCKLFTTIEGIIDEYLLAQMGKTSEEVVKVYNSYAPYLYSITSYIAEREKIKGINCAEKVLYLGVDPNKFLSTVVRKHSLSNIVFIGNSLVRKRASEFIRMAQDFPRLIFHIVGGNQLEGNVTVEEYLKINNINNCIYHGSLDHSHLSELLNKMDIMFFPSRSEGFPKVMLETACAGVPTLCYRNYGADEWITSGVDGFVVDTYEEAVDVINDLLDHPQKLHSVSAATIELGKRFDWKILVKDWENEIEKIAKGENDD